MSARVELNRVMQENIKNILENIAENVRKENIEWIRNFGDVSCSSPTAGNVIVSGIILCIWWDEYALGTWEPPFLPVSSLSECNDIDSLCRILKKDVWTSAFYPLTNSFVHFENISFVVTNTDIPKVNINITARPVYNKGLSPAIITNNTMHIQTSISQRLIETH